MSPRLFNGYRRTQTLHALVAVDSQVGAGGCLDIEAILSIIEDAVEVSRRVCKFYRIAVAQVRANV